MNDILIEDILPETGTDLMFLDGDFFVADSSRQDVALILNYGKGHLRQYPELGVHIDLFNNGIWNYAIKKTIVKECNRDGYIPKNIYKDGDEIKIEI